MTGINASKFRTKRPFPFIRRIKSGQTTQSLVDVSPRDMEIWKRVAPYTMTSIDRVLSLTSAVRYVVENNIPGDFVECGVWRGGSAMAITSVLVDCGVKDRQVWLYDTYEGMTSPTEFDIEAPSGRHASELLGKIEAKQGRNVWCIAGLSDVKRNLESTGYPSDQIRYVAGDVSKTLVAEKPSRIALLRLDTDWFESTSLELQYLYPRLSIHGVCIIDDYGHWSGAKLAVDEYFDHNGPKPLMHRIDYTGRIMLKTH